MNEFKDKYLREKFGRIITRQMEGKAVMAAYKEGSQLPPRKDLGQGYAEWRIDRITLLAMPFS